jgi:D-aminoacyl-tRNA deacylase
MRALVQRVSKASVIVDGEVVGAIDRGLLILLGVHHDDDESIIEWTARKCSALRIFPDEAEKMNRSVIDVSGQLLVVSQFTLYGDASRGNRPSFTDSAPPEKAIRMYELFVARLREVSGLRVETGVFGAMMSVQLVNDGPVTILVEREVASE